MSVVKAFLYPVKITWEGAQATRVTASGRPPLEVATPPEFRGGVEGPWSPEDLLVAAAGGCYATTVAAIAEARGLELRSLAVEGLGHVEKRLDGRLGFVAVELSVSIETTPGHREELEAAARRAEKLCLVSAALDVPVHVALAVHELEGALT